MRRFKALLIVAGLAAAPASAAAGPCPQDSDSTHSFSESYAFTAGHGRLGVMVMGLTPELRQHFGVARDRGVMVAKVETGSAAAAAGLRAGDIITGVRGRAVGDAGDVIAAIADAPKDQDVKVDVMRDGKALTLDAKLTSSPMTRQDPWSEAWLRDWMRPLFELPHLPPLPPAASATSTAST